MGGEPPKNRKKEGKANKQRQQRAEDGDKPRKESDGKPVVIKGMGYVKQVPKFIQDMMDAGQKKGGRERPTDRDKDDLSLLPSFNDPKRLAKLKNLQPDHDRFSAYAATLEQPKSAFDPATLKAPAAPKITAAEYQRNMQKLKEEEQRYATGRGVQAATGTARVIFQKKRKPEQRDEEQDDGAAAAASEGGLDEFGRSRGGGGGSGKGGDKRKKKKKREKVKANPSMLSFDVGDDE